MFCPNPHLQVQADRAAAAQANSSYNRSDGRNPYQNDPLYDKPLLAQVSVLMAGYEDMRFPGVVRQPTDLSEQS